MIRASPQRGGPLRYATSPSLQELEARGDLADHLTYTCDRFHYPRQGWKYKCSDFRILEIHTFAFDNDSPKIEGTQVRTTQEDARWSLCPVEWKRIQGRQVLR